MQKDNDDVTCNLAGFISDIKHNAEIVSVTQIVVAAIRLMANPGPFAEPDWLWVSADRTGTGMRFGGHSRLNFSNPRGVVCIIEATLVFVLAPAKVLPLLQVQTSEGIRR